MFPFFRNTKQYRLSQNVIIFSTPFPICRFRRWSAAVVRDGDLRPANAHAASERIIPDADIYRRRARLGPTAKNRHLRNQHARPQRAHPDERLHAETGGKTNR